MTISSRIPSLTALDGRTLHRLHKSHEAGDLTLTVDVQEPEGLAHHVEARTTTFQLARMPYPAAEEYVFRALDWVRHGSDGGSSAPRFDVTVFVRDGEGRDITTPEGGDLNVNDLLALLTSLQIAVDKASTRRHDNEAFKREIEAGA